MNTNTSTTSRQTQFNRIGTCFGEVSVYGTYNEDEAITIAKQFIPKGWTVDTGADWSDDLQCWIVPAFPI